MERLKGENLTITWLRGGVTHMDGGAMFGVVPKPLWSKKYPVNEKNQIELRCDPMLLQVDGKNILIESGIGNGKFTEKQKRNYGVTEESFIIEDLQALGLTPTDIDIILMTHLHFDHACGLTKKVNNQDDASLFENAIIYVNDIEWNEIKNPNIRSRNTYWEENWRPIASQVQTYEKEIEVLPGIKMIHTGGHSDGHAIFSIERDGEHFLHFADIMPTVAHDNPLWVLAYDDYPMNSIFEKQKWIPYIKEKEGWILFYHDVHYRAVKWNHQGEIIDCVKRQSVGTK